MFVSFLSIQWKSTVAFNMGKNSLNVLHIIFSTEENTGLERYEYIMTELKFFGESSHVIKLSVPH